MHDEYIRLKKYTYGAAEICFNKIKDWPKKGIFHESLKKFISSKYPFTSKVPLTAYLHMLQWQLHYHY